MSVESLKKQIADLKENYRVTLENLFSANQKKIEMQNTIHQINSEYEVCYQAKQELEGRLSKIQKMIYKELRETPCGAEWGESHLRSVLSSIATMCKKGESAVLLKEGEAEK